MTVDRCFVCDCSEHDACFDVNGACAWFVPFLCTFCVLDFRAPPFSELLPSYATPMAITHG